MHKQHQDLTAEQVRALLRYEPETGLLFWKERTGDLFKSAGQCKRWNIRYADKQAFTSSNGKGYRAGEIFGVKYVAHRIAWLIHTGSWPKAELDHMNGVRSDNRILNLREVSRVQNMRNRKLHANNTSGVNGVSWCRARGKWLARLQIGDRDTYLGLFDTIEAAAEARATANIGHGFSTRHGTLTPPPVDANLPTDRAPSPCKDAPHDQR